MQTSYWLTRFWFQRSLGTIYLLGFLIAANQFRALCGSDGILPARLFLKRVTFWDAPSLFWLNSSDTAFLVAACVGVALAVLALSGLSDAFGYIVSAVVWFSLWLLYLSFVNIGQTFYGFGWETLLLETGFLAIFLGPTKAAPPVIVIWLLRWILFRLMFGAGMIKIRGDECWRDLTCMNYHWETQPMPNPLSWYLHLLPEWANKGAVLFNHFVELVVPFFFFGPRMFRQGAGVLTIVFQGILILSGNLSWLNYITIVVAISCFDDSFLPGIPAFLEGILGRVGAATDISGASGVFLWISGGMPSLLIYSLVAVIFILSIQPALNLFSSTQVMNSSFDPLHLVNTYGAFGSITRTRNEVVIEGTDDEMITIHTKWKEYGFKGKPGEVDRMPPVISPYHLRLDWQMWFAAMSPYWQHPWILNFMAKLLEGNSQVLSLLRVNPFPDHPPRYVRALLYEYHFADRGLVNEFGKPRWWERKRVAPYLAPLSLNDPEFRDVLKSQEWLAPNE
jgi:Lipase maturation factor